MFCKSDDLFPVPVEELGAKRKEGLSLGHLRGRGAEPRSLKENPVSRPYREKQGKLLRDHFFEALVVTEPI